MCRKTNYLLRQQEFSSALWQSTLNFTERRLRVNCKAGFELPEIDLAKIRYSSPEAKFITPNELKVYQMLDKASLTEIWGVLYRNCPFLGNAGRLERARVWKRIDITITRRRLLLLGDADVDDALHQSGPGEAPEPVVSRLNSLDH
ncbi:hypothetical protein TcasGA2_TC011955 [Tribolium castaneum]|uniref:Uncharacterized protein n=1 Tax=Tribolium castaneum TaxID=7070 RepID=D6X311_TRICA|nr:hypothetical protein TcasGA2_TC011955 [Tribolium castaneum]